MDSQITKPEQPTELEDFLVQEWLRMIFGPTYQLPEQEKEKGRDNGPNQ